MSTNTNSGQTDCATRQRVYYTKSSQLQTCKWCNFNIHTETSDANCALPNPRPQTHKWWYRLVMWRCIVHGQPKSLWWYRSSLLQAWSWARRQQHGLFHVKSVFQSAQVVSHNHEPKHAARHFHMVTLVFYAHIFTICRTQHTVSVKLNADSQQPVVRNTTWHLRRWLKLVQCSYSETTARQQTLP